MGQIPHVRHGTVTPSVTARHRVRCRGVARRPRARSLITMLKSGSQADGGNTGADSEWAGAPHHPAQTARGATCGRVAAAGCTGNHSWLL